MSLTLKILQPALDSISEMENVWLKFIDQSGKYIATTQRRQQCAFCRYIRSSVVGERRCRGSARQAVFRAKDKTEPVFFECHAGLTMVSVPITISGVYLGALAFGEILEKPKTSINLRVNDLGLEEDEAIKLYHKIPGSSWGYVNQLAKNLNSISKCFIEIGIILEKANKTEFN